VKYSLLLEDDARQAQPQRENADAESPSSVVVVSVAANVDDGRGAEALPTL